jgi:hypothetical protein
LKSDNKEKSKVNSITKALFPARHRQQVAEAAAYAWTGVAPTAQARTWIEHVTRLAAQKPAVEINWLRQDTRSERLAGRGLALSHSGIWVRPICGLEGYLVALHELGHRRANHGGMDRLDLERTAWLWAREQSLDWNPDAQRFMEMALGTYLATARKTDLPAVQRIEDELLGAAAYRKELQRRVEAQLKEERAKYRFTY